MVGYVVTQDFAKRIKEHYDSGVLAGTQSVIHGWKHVYDVAWAAQRIVHDEEGGSREAAVAFVAGLLHDWCRQPEFKLKQTGKTDEHEKEGAANALEMLPKEGFDEQFTKDVAKAIETHSFGISIHGDRGEGAPESLAAMALKAADKHEQCKPGVVWVRAVFIGETTGGNTSDDEILAYCRKREKKLSEFLDGPIGQMLSKHYHKAPQGLAFVKEFNDELEKEIRLAGENPGFDGALSKIGARGIMRQGQAFGAQGKPAIAFKKAFDAQYQSIEVPKGLESVAAFTVRMMMVRI